MLLAIDFFSFFFWIFFTICHSNNLNMFSFPSPFIDLIPPLFSWLSSSLTPPHPALRPSPPLPVWTSLAHHQNHPFTSHPSALLHCRSTPGRSSSRLQPETRANGGRINVSRSELLKSKPHSRKVHGSLTQSLGKWWAAAKQDLSHNATRVPSMQTRHTCSILANVDSKVAVLLFSVCPDTCSWQHLYFSQWFTFDRFYSFLCLWPS